jgi:hypothetical protein
MPSVNYNYQGVQGVQGVQPSVNETKLICILCNEESSTLTREHSCTLRNNENEKIIIANSKRNYTI